MLPHSISAFFGTNYIVLESYVTTFDTLIFCRHLSVFESYVATSLYISEIFAFTVEIKLLWKAMLSHPISIFNGNLSVLQ